MKTTSWPRWRLRYLLNKKRTAEEIERLKNAQEISFIPMGAVGENGGLNLSTVREQENISNGYTLFFEDDVLVAKITPCFENGKGAIAKGLVNGVGFGTTELYVLDPKPIVDPRFLFYLTISHGFRMLGEASMKGAAGQKRVPDEFIQNFEFNLPPVDTQYLVADYLDRETAHIDTLVTEKEGMLALLEEKRVAFISRAVTRGLDPNVMLKPSGLNWLGNIPTHWLVMQMRFACHSLQTGPFGSQLHAEEYIDNGIPVINPAHLKYNKITPDFGISVNEETANRLSVHKLKEGDVVFGRRGELGRCGVVDNSQEGWLCGTGSLKVRCNLEKIHPKYLASVFNNTLAAKRLSAESVGSTMDNLNTEMMGHFRIPLPPLDEQQRIVRKIDSINAKAEALIATLKDSIDLAKERRSALITAAVSGQIPVKGMSA